MAASRGTYSREARRSSGYVNCESADVTGADRLMLEPWLPTIQWLLKQAAFGVLGPHLELPDELAVALILSTQSVQLPVAASLQLKPVVEVTPADVVATHADPSIGAAAAKEASVTLVAKIKSPAGAKEPKWEPDARAQVRLAVRRFAKPLQDLVTRDANEGDTRLLITDMLCERLSYDKFRDLTTEYIVKQDYSPVTVSESTSNLSPSSRSNA
ncbi:hypothetical protein [Paenarthrobacter sp. PH39-S1]|uniref:hypothetical protein n=1 Tax=Paenarthrobacter sp. PH39-S1 TaxID=3046204 RepID=UPI0024B9370D|nr:hypothetical protein [Paenarthrobacter sp. PH39-S1]MDJ0357627.1 hypothetical protein [Paenarthrobacter sp. PH39-S1]